MIEPDSTRWRRAPGAPEPGTPLGPLDALEDGTAREYSFADGPAQFSMFLVRRGEDVFGYVNLCPHFGTPLNLRSPSFLTKDGARIRCTSHFSEFRIDDGFGLSGHGEGCWLDPVPVEIADGVIVIAAG